MYSNLAIALLAVSFLASAESIYSKNSAVLQVTSKTYESLIAQSNHTSIVEFYAPWCGHCQNLKPAYEKAAKNLAGLAKVAAVNCDEDENKGLCGQMGVQGFPTLKIVKPGSKKGRPMIEDYKGPRAAKAIVDAVIDKIPNHVKKVQDADLESWSEDTSSQAKAILFTDKATISPLIKSLAIDFLGSINFAQIRNKEQNAVDKYSVTKYPTIVLLPGKGQESITYDGAINKDSLVKFFSQITPPNPDPAPKKVKSKTKPSAKKPQNHAADPSADPAACPMFSEASKAQKSSEFEDHMDKTGTVIVDEGVPTESPLPIVENQQKPMDIKQAAPSIPQLATLAELQSSCFAPKSGTCVLVLLPAQNPLPDSAAEALSSFAEVSHKHTERGANIFPFFGIPSENTAGDTVRKTLGLSSESLEILAVNKKRKWWRAYTSEAYSTLDAESFVDAIRLGEGPKNKLPADLLVGEEHAAEEAASAQATGESPSEPAGHDEL